MTERARVVIGADGRHSLVAKSVQPEQYDERPSRLAMYYAYWSGLPADGFDTDIRAENRRGWAAARTHDDLTVVPFGWPVEEFHANRKDIEGNFLATVDLAPEFAERVRGAKRESKFFGSAELPGYFRKPFGPGWALVGDAGYHKNPITAMGINDAFRDAELVADALDDSFSGRRSFEEGMSDYQRARDQEALPVYEFTDDFAQLQPPRPRCSSCSERCATTRRRWTGSSACRRARCRRRSSSPPRTSGESWRRPKPADRAAGVPAPIHSTSQPK